MAVRASVVWKTLWLLVAVIFITVSLHTLRILKPSQLDDSGYQQELARFARHVSSLQGVSEKDITFDSDSRHDCYCDAVDNDDVTSSVTSAPTRQPLITLFTSMKDTIERREIHNHTIHNWAALRPEVLPVLYTDDATGRDLSELALSLGWSTRPVPSAFNHIPSFKGLFEDAISNFNTPYYSFANADILFDGSLIETLRALQVMNVTNAHYRWTAKPQSITAKTTTEQLKRRPASGGVLIVGRRTNVNTSDISHDLIQPAKVKQLAHSKGQLFNTNAQDYFITTAEGIPWKLVPNFVIGRPGYDNWLVVKALDWKLTAVDATEGILAVHQTGSEGNLAGWASANSTLCYNRNLVPRFDYRPGHTKCLLWAVQRDIAATLRVFRRSVISKDCARIGRYTTRNMRCKGN